MNDHTMIKEDHTSYYWTTCQNVRSSLSGMVDTDRFILTRYYETHEILQSCCYFRGLVRKDSCLRVPILYVPKFNDVTYTRITKNLVIQKTFGLQRSFFQLLTFIFYILCSYVLSFLFLFSLSILLIDSFLG